MSLNSYPFKRPFQMTLVFPDIPTCIETLVPMIIPIESPYVHLQRHLYSPLSPLSASERSPGLRASYALAGPSPINPGVLHKTCFKLGCLKFENL